MIVDRRFAKWTNAVLGMLALGAIGAIGFLANAKRDIERPIQYPRETQKFRDAKGAAYAAEGRGDFTKAEQRYRTAFATRPDSLEARFGLARTYLANGKRPEAWALYRPAIDPYLAAEKVPPGGYDALAWYADLAMEFGKAEYAERAARLTERYPSPRPIARKRLLAGAHLSAADSNLPIPIALRHADRASEIDPKSLYPHLTQASLLLKAKRTQAGNAQITTAKKLAAQGSASDWIALGSFFHQEDRAEEVRSALLQAARRTASNDSRGWLALYHIAWNWSRPSLKKSLGLEGKLFARTSLRKALDSVPPSDAETLLDLSSVLSSPADALPDQARAKSFVESALKATTHHETILYGRIASQLARLGEKARAKTMIEKAMRQAEPKDRAWLDSTLAQIEGRPGAYLSSGGGR